MIGSSPGWPENFFFSKNNLNNFNKVFLYELLITSGYRGVQTPNPD